MFGKTLLSVFTIPKISCKENSGLSDLCLSLVPLLWTLIYFLPGKTISGKGIFYVMFDHFCPSVPMSIFVWDRRRRDDDVATNLGLPGPASITPRKRIPREGPPHLDFAILARRLNLTVGDTNRFWLIPLLWETVVILADSVEFQISTEIY